MRPRHCALLILLVLPACLWRSYGAIMTVHLDVLTSMVAKTVDNAASGHRPTSNDVTELTYPLQRGQQFVQQFESYRERESYRQFLVLLERYEAFVQSIDAARADPARWEALQASLPASAAALQETATQVRAALARGT